MAMRSRRQRFVDQSGSPRLAMLIVAAALVVVGCRSGKTTWSRVQESGVLRVGMDPSYPPFETTDGVQLAGIDVDMARAIVKILSLNVEFRSIGYDGLYDALLTDQVDVLVSALTIQPEREQDFMYSRPYFNAGQVLIMPEQSLFDGPALRTLKHGTIAVELGSRGHVEALQQAKLSPELIVDAYDTSDAAMTAVAEGSAVAAIVDSVSGRMFLRSQHGLVWREEVTMEEPYAMVVRAGDRQLLDRLNEALDELADNGTLSDIFDLWLGASNSKTRKAIRH